MSRQALVLAIEPDLRQAAIVKRVVKERVQADVVVVDSPDAAIAAIRTAIPDVLLLSALLSPRDEDDLIAHLRTLEGASHLQTHTIPQLASALGRGEDGGGGLFSAFRRKKASPSVPAGCDPDLFADEVRVYLERAAAKRREASEAGSITPLPSIAARLAEKPPVVHEEAAEAPGSSWSSPFEWRPANRSSFIANPQIPNPPIADHPIPNPVDAVPPIEEFDPVLAAPTPDSVIQDSAIQDSAIQDSVIQDSAIRDAAIQDAAIQDSVIQDSAIQDAAIRDAAIRDAAIRDSAIRDAAIRDSRIRDEGLRIHTPAPLAVWARKETPKGEAPEVECEFATFFARLGMPEGVASVAYPEGVRIRRVRVRAAKDPHPSLHGAMLLGKRMLAELSGSHPA